MQVTKEVLEQYQKDLAAAMQISDDLAQLNELNEIEQMADQPELVYKLLLKIVPKTNSKFTPYIKSGFPRAN